MSADTRLLVAAALMTLWGCASVNSTPTASEAPTGNFSHEAFDRVLNGRVGTRGDVDYAAIVADRRDLDTYLAALAERSPDTHPEAFEDPGEVLAYWLNAYNATVIGKVVEHYPVESVLDIRPSFPLSLLPRTVGFFVFQRGTYGGRTASLYGLEHVVVRRRFGDARVHFALNCASRSCPKLPRNAFKGSNLDRVLDREPRRFIAEPRNVSVDGDSREIRLSSIFDWYESDFVEYQEKRGGTPSLLGFVERFASAELQEQLARCRDCEVVFETYDWGLNEQAR